MIKSFKNIVTHKGLDDPAYKPIIKISAFGNSTTVPNIGHSCIRELQNNGKPSIFIFRDNFFLSKLVRFNFFLKDVTIPFSMPNW